MTGSRNMSRLFVSYARDDDEAFARRLVAALTAAGHHPWIDRAQMSSRGRAYLHELREAIASSDRILAVVGPSALRSDYVRLEWETALSCDKPVLPLLRLGKYADMPAYIDL